MGLTSYLNPRVCNYKQAFVSNLIHPAAVSRFIATVLGMLLRLTL